MEEEYKMKTELNTVGDTSPQEKFLHGIIMLAIYGGSALGIVLLFWWLLS
jgi:hypothetical protein